MTIKAAQELEIKKKLLENYPIRKSWHGTDNFLKYSEIFETEVKRTGITSGAYILEIGFGDGLFLDWAKTSGFNITGIEINPDFVNLAKARGHKVYLGNPEEIFKNASKLFDLVCFFNVLEHLHLEEIVKLLKTVRSIIKENGRVLARFPNGASPFGRAHQHWDATHVTTLSGAKMEDIAMLTGMKLISIHNGARSMKYGTRNLWVLKEIAYVIRDFLQLLIGYLYFGENIPMDPDMTVILAVKK